MLLKRPLRALLIALISAVEGLSADIAFVGRIERDRSTVVFSWANKDQVEPVLVNLGTLVGSYFSFAETIKMRVSGPHMGTHSVVKGNEPAGGNFKAFVICLLPGAQYDLYISAKDLHLSGSSKTLADLGSDAFALSVEFTGRRPIVPGVHGQFVPYDGIAQYGRKFNMWMGKRETIIKP